jgi:hypothetical protein
LITQTLFIGNSLFDSWTTEKEQVHAELHTPRSIGFCCSSCGDLWARIVTEENGRLQKFWFLQSPCPRCPADWSDRAPGSIVKDWDKHAWAHFPLSVMKREFDLAYNYYMEQHNGTAKETNWEATVRSTAQG